MRKRAFAPPPASREYLAIAIPAVLVTGALPSLNIAGLKFRSIAQPKQPKPGIGLLLPS